MSQASKDNNEVAPESQVEEEVVKLPSLQAASNNCQDDQAGATEG